MGWPDVNRYDDRVPIYRQIAGFIRGRIEAGAYAPGDRLPSIVDIMGEWGVGKEVGFKALRALREEGYARLARGMGHYVPTVLPERDQDGTRRRQTEPEGDG